MTDTRLFQCHSERGYRPLARLWGFLVMALLLGGCAPGSWVAGPSPAASSTAPQPMTSPRFHTICHQVIGDVARSVGADAVKSLVIEVESDRSFRDTVTCRFEWRSNRGRFEKLSVDGELAMHYYHPDWPMDTQREIIEKYCVEPRVKEKEVDSLRVCYSSYAASTGGVQLLDGRVAVKLLFQTIGGADHPARDQLASTAVDLFATAIPRALTQHR